MGSYTSVHFRSALQCWIGWIDEATENNGVLQHGLFWYLYAIRELWATEDRRFGRGPVLWVSGWVLLSFAF